MSAYAKMQAISAHQGLWSRKKRYYGATPPSPFINTVESAELSEVSAIIMVSMLSVEPSPTEWLAITGKPDSRMTLSSSVPSTSAILGLPLVLLHI